MTPWYHLIVSRRPALNGVDERNPNSLEARSTLSLRRGWPSGFDRSHATLPLKPVSSTTKVSFRVPGTYVLRAIASDGALEAVHDVTVTVNQ